MEYDLFKPDFCGITLNIGCYTLFGHLDCPQFERDMTVAVGTSLMFIFIAFQ